MALVTCKNSPFKQGVALVMCERIKASNNSFLEFAGPALGLIMYIVTSLEFPIYNFDFHLLITSLNGKYYYKQLIP